MMTSDFWWIYDYLWSIWWFDDDLWLFFMVTWWFEQVIYLVAAS